MTAHNTPAVNFKVFFFQTIFPTLDYDLFVFFSNKSIQYTTAKLIKYNLSLSPNLYFLLISQIKDYLRKAQARRLRRLSDFLNLHFPVSATGAS